MPSLRIKYPIKGLDKGVAYSDQPELTTPDSMNETSLDPIAKRYRGGQRSGTSKHLGGSQVVDSSAVADMIHVAIGANPAPVTTAKIDWRFDTGDDARDVSVDSGGNAYVVGERFNSKSFWKLLAVDGTESFSFDTQGVTRGVAVDPNDGSIVIVGDRAVQPDSSSKTIWKLDSSGALLWDYDTGLADVNAHRSVEIDSSGNIYAGIKRNSLGGKVRNLFSLDSDGNIRWYGDSTSGIANHANRMGFDSTHTHIFVTCQESPQVANMIYKYKTSDGSLVWRDDLSGADSAQDVVVSSDDSNLYISQQQTAGAQIVAKGSDDPTGFTAISVYNSVEATHLTANGIAIDSTDNIYVITDEFLTKLDSDLNLLWTITLEVDVSAKSLGLALYDDRYIYITGARTTSPSNASVWRYDGQELSTIQIKKRAITEAYASNGTLKTYDGTTLSAVTGSYTLSAAQNVTFSIALNGVFYYVDGTNYNKLVVSTNTASTWTASAGTLPVSGSDTARLIERYMGRVALSGVVGDDQNIVFSRVLDAEDVDTAAAITNKLDPVKLNISEAGVIGAMVTGMIPYHDDLMIVGTDQSISMVTGNPSALAGGQIDTRSEETGMAWGRAWAISPDGNIFFYGSNGVYVMTVSGDSISGPTLIKPGTIEEDLMQVDLSTHLIRLAWDTRHRGLHVFITKNASASISTHYFWSQLTDSWHRFQYPSNHGPLSVHVLDGDEFQDRAILLGGRDGYVRKLDSDADDDDGSAIGSYVVYPPIRLSSVDEIGIRRISVTLADNTNDLSYEIRASNSPETVLGTAAIATGTWTSGGRQADIRTRARGNTVSIKLFNNTNDSKWGIEDIQIEYDVLGPVRAA
jgi:hypothetical protein